MVCSRFGQEGRRRRQQGQILSRAQPAVAAGRSSDMAPAIKLATGCNPPVSSHPVTVDPWLLDFQQQGADNLHMTNPVPLWNREELGRTLAGFPWPASSTVSTPTPALSAFPLLQQRAAGKTERPILLLFYSV